MQLATSLRDLVESAQSLVYIEDLSSKKGFLQSFNPLAKLAAIFVMIVTSLFVPSLFYLTLMCVIPISLALLSKIPIKDFLSRTAIIPLLALVISIPVLFFTSGTIIFKTNLGLFNLAITYQGIERFLFFTIRTWFCVATLTLFMFSTGFNSFLRLLSSIRVPQLLIQLFVLTYRYLFVSICEVQKVLIAKEARTYFTRHTLTLTGLKQSGALLATIFIRTYERSERVYMAMKSRGFDINSTHKTHIPPIRAKDLIFSALTIIIFGLIAFF